MAGSGVPGKDMLGVRGIGFGGTGAHTRQWEGKVLLVEEVRFDAGQGLIVGFTGKVLPMQDALEDNKVIKSYTAYSRDNWRQEHGN